MKILITGAAGFVGRNLSESLKSIRDGKDRTHRIAGLENPADLEIIEYDLNTDPAVLEEACRDCDFVFNLAGVNRPENPEDFQKGNFGFASHLLDLLERNRNQAPVMLSSSIQASLSGRYAGSEYGRSKLAGEALFFAYEQRTGAPVLVYRFANLFGKWCRPNYNSVVATFCHNIAHGLPLTISDPAVQLELVYIDDLVEEMIRALNGQPTRCDFEETRAIRSEHGKYCTVPVSHTVTLGELADRLQEFAAQPETLFLPAIPENSLKKKLYSTYLSYLPEEKICFDLKTNEDSRGSFTELLKTADHGQFSVNISRPGITKGQHWHHSKWEFFIVVSGTGLIQMRRIGSDEVLEFPVSGEKIQAVHMLPGYTHNIINLSESENLVTLMWANEPFDPEHPDTYSEPVQIR